jgi:hypothetical protein
VQCWSGFDNLAVANPYIMTSRREKIERQKEEALKPVDKWQRSMEKDGSPAMLVVLVLSPDVSDHCLKPTSSTCPSISGAPPGSPRFVEMQSAGNP